MRFLSFRYSTDFIRSRLVYVAVCEKNPVGDALSEFGSARVHSGAQSAEPADGRQHRGREEREEVQPQQTRPHPRL